MEVPPVNGTLLIFPNGPTTWHGHKQFVGTRYGAGCTSGHPEASVLTQCVRVRLAFDDEDVLTPTR